MEKAITAQYENILTWWYKDGNFRKTHEKQGKHKEQQSQQDVFIDKYGNEYLFSILGPCSCAHLLFTVKYATE